MKGKVDEHDVCVDEYSPCVYSLTKQTECRVPTIDGTDSHEFPITQDNCSAGFYYAKTTTTGANRRRCTEIEELASSGTSLNSSIDNSDEPHDAIDSNDASSLMSPTHGRHGDVDGDGDDDNDNDYDSLHCDRTAPIAVPDKNGGPYYEAGGMAAKAKSQSTNQIEQLAGNAPLTSSSIENKSSFDLTAYVINSSDGFQEVQCYIDENGSPKVREKHAKKSRRKHTLRQELKARSLGASYDDNLLLRKPIDTNKTPTCVSFTKLFKKFRETFCK